MTVSNWQLEKEIALLDDQISIYRKRIQFWEQELNKATRERSSRASQLAIRTHNIRLEDVELSSGPGVPYFFITYKFAEHLKAKGTTKPWAEWNTNIYRMADFLNGNISSPVCDLDDLKGESK